MGLALFGESSFEFVVGIAALVRAIWVHTYPGKAGKGEGKVGRMASYQPGKAPTGFQLKMKPFLLALVALQGFLAILRLVVGDVWGGISDCIVAGLGYIWRRAGGGRARRPHPWMNHLRH